MNVVNEGKHSGAEVELCMTVATSAYVLFALVHAAVAFPYIWFGFAGKLWAWRVVAGISTALAGFLCYFAFMRLCIDHGVMTYRSLFTRWSLPVSDIANSEMQWNIAGRDPRPFLVITSFDGRKVRANLKPFRRADIRVLLNLPELKFRKSENVA